ncbi:MAG: flagellar basal body P-ring protein FlgI [Candidatus Eisenbacteria bacterium]|uniref:Flagellar P-ring protein n=1 Tax=Eiseniibacteriota bacterium TaxID=2212470 RepID=A0A849SFR1_UNCEI|nr:flagellar basal body P-ring protein FlgI [Candidatus Eisenbacteria bacterium]
MSRVMPFRLESRRASRGVRPSHRGRHFVIATALALLTVFVVLGVARAACAAPRVADLTRHAGDVPRRLVGYGLVTGLDGSGDRSLGSLSGGTQTVRSVVNLLRRFGVEVPAEQLRIRNVAAVLVTAEVSPWLRAGGRFDVQVSAMGDASSLRGGVLWTTPLVEGPDSPAIASAQGTLLSPDAPNGRSYGALRSNSARVSDGGVIEVDPEVEALVADRLLLVRPDARVAEAIARAINRTFGVGTARPLDPGSISLRADSVRSSEPMRFLAAVDTVSVPMATPARLVVTARDGTVVAGGELQIGPAVVHHRNFTLQVGGGTGTTAEGLVRVNEGSRVQDVVAGLHAAGATAEDLVAIFEALRAVGALDVELVVR